VTFESYWPLCLIALVPVLWWAVGKTSLDLSRWHLWLLAAARSVIVILLAFTLARPTLTTFTADVSVVYLLDVSRSVSPAAIRDAIEWMRKTNAAGRPSTARFMAFGANARVFDNVDDLGKVQVADGPPEEGAVDRSATALASAIERAEQAFAPNHLKRIVVMSDGNDNSGDLRTALARLRASRVRVFTHAMNSRSNPDVWVEGVAVPDVVTAEEPFSGEVQIFSQTAVTADIQISAGGRELTRQQARLTEGLNTIPFETQPPDESGPIALEARVAAREDSFNDNNVYYAPLWVEARPRVLYVEGRLQSATYLQKALTAEGLRVDVREPAATPSSLAELDRYDAVVLSDVEGKSLSPAVMQNIEAYVRDLGGGLILAGGENVYGENGYSKTPIEKALPATFDVTRKKPPTVAMIVVMDNSASMRGFKMELAKEAAKAPLELLRDVDHYGVNTFATGPVDWIVQLTGANNRADILKSISSIAVSVPTGTDAFFSMQAAFESLNKATDEVKTVLFLTDGQMTVPRDYRSLTMKMREAGIRITTVAIGAGADRELLGDIAMLGKGRSYYLAGATNVPQIFMRETELSMDRALREEQFNVIVKRDVEAFKGLNLLAAPNLLGYMATKPKPTADILLTESIGGDPVLMRWQHGLGKAVLFASDLKDRWAANWVSWNGYGKFWSQLVRETMRRENPYFDLRVERGDGDEEALVSVEAIDKDGRFRNLLSVESRMMALDAGGQNTAEINLAQTGPGRYEARAPIRPDGSYVFRAAAEGDSAARVTAYSYPAEYRFYPTDEEKLKAISEQAGGVFNPEGPEIFNTQDESLAIPYPLWPVFAALALVFYLVDLLLRRLRLFEA
jgi:uncharacterized membrane protein